MKVLVACEESQAVCKAFRELGHEAYSCDIQECSGGHPEWHILGDVLMFLNGSGDEHKMRFRTQEGNEHVLPKKWDLIIAFPPCTDLAASGARYFKAKQADGRQQRSIAFFLEFTKANCQRICIENPVGIMSTKYRKPDQIIQPWQFGHGEQKATCLWLKELPMLKPTQVVEGREQRVWKMPPSQERAKLRSKTYPGIAKAMAEQWGGFCNERKDSE